MCSDAIETVPLRDVVERSRTVFVGTLVSDAWETETRKLDEGHSWTFHFQRFRVESVVRSTFPLKKGDVVRVFGANQEQDAWRGIEYQKSGVNIGLFLQRGDSPTAIHPKAGQKAIVMGNGTSCDRFTLYVDGTYEPPEELPRIRALLGSEGGR